MPFKNDKLLTLSNIHMLYQLIAEAYQTKWCILWIDNMNIHAFQKHIFQQNGLLSTTSRIHCGLKQDAAFLCSQLMQVVVSLMQKGEGHLKPWNRNQLHPICNDRQIRPASTRIQSRLVCQGSTLPNNMTISVNPRHLQLSLACLWNIYTG